ncbi:MAG: 5'-nucleotidase C-terminal domain-containing protein, partial [Flavobacteriales bacterium]|nr:5'-nucleotidase C-terminal domain-containing protein [Flavobacteriales bacterium]
GDQFEQLIATVLPSEFNSNNTDNGSFDSRSDDKGPEPEAIEIAEIGGEFYAFIGLERISGIMVYNVTDPVNPVFVQYVNNRDFTGDVSLGTAKDAGVETLKFIPAANSPNGKDLLVSGNEISGTVTLFEINVPAPTFTLQLLHASDLEGGVDAIGNAPNFAAIMDALEDTEPNTIRLSAGDNYIPGPFFNAASNRTVLDPVLRGIYNDIFGAGTSDFLRSAEGRADITIMNILQFDASAVGNHEFDAGTDIAAAIWGTEPNGGGNRWLGAQFPYLSANLDFSGDGNLSGLFTPFIAPNTDYITPPNTVVGGEAKIAPATTILRDGELIGVVGATTQLIESITSNGGVSVVGPTSNDMPALAAILQPVIDQLTNNGVNKIILVTHLQQLALEQQLVGLLSGVDIIVAGGSDAILADGDDVLRPGDIADGPYPFLTTNLDGDPAVIVSTDGEYSYVGRLVVDFDASGVLLTGSIDPLMNGPVATTDANVTALWGDLVTPFNVGTKGELVQRLTSAIEGIVIAQDGNVFGKTDVFLEGRREFVRTEETNLGNFTSDANLFYAQVSDASAAVSLKNGGGIRAAIGEVVETSPGVYDLLPPQANPLSGKLEGEVSQLDIANSLRFNNALSLVTLTPGQLLQVLEHGVAAWAPGATPGQMCQIGGMAFSFDPALPSGSRVRNAVVKDLNGATTDTIAMDGNVHGDPTRPIRMVTLSFLADGGDSYPFPGFQTADPAFFDRVDLATATQTGTATFANDGTEQDAFAEYLAANFSSTPYNDADTPIDQDERIQNLSFRPDAIFGQSGFAPQLIASQCGKMDFLAGDFVISGLDPAVTAEYGVGNNADDGYQFRFTDPNSSYARNVFFSHAAPVVGAPAGPSAAAYMRPQNLQTNPIPLDVLLEVRIRSRVNGVNGPWGAPCEIMVLSAPPACPSTQLVDNVNSPNFSCGVTRSFGGSDKVVAEPVAGATHYRFRFEDGLGFVRNIAGPSPARILKWITTPLQDGVTYDVRVAVSFDGGANYCPYGAACQVTISNGPAAASLRIAEATNPAVMFWPNPNGGDVLHLQIDGLDESSTMATLDILDLTGKLVLSKAVPATAGGVRTSIELNGLVSKGMYLMRISTGDRTITERLMID